jgi:glutathione S-transferase
MSDGSKPDKTRIAHRLCGVGVQACRAIEVASDTIPIRHTPMKIMNFICRGGSRRVGSSAYGDEPVNESRLRLYVDAQFTSPYAMSAFVVLREKGIEFELCPLNLETGEHQLANYANLSQTQRVPTLVHDDFALSESSAITEYLEDAFPRSPVYPQDLQHRAKARQVQAWLRSDLLPIRQERSTLVVFYGRQSGPLSPEAESAASKLFAAAQTLLAGNPDNLFGQWSIADVDLTLMLNRLILNGDPVPPALVEYAQRQWQRPSVQQWVRLQRPPI